MPVETPAAVTPTGTTAADPVVPAAVVETAAVLDKAPVVPPVVYTLTLPEKSPLDPKVLDRVTELAKANALSQATAEQVVALTHTEVAETLKVLDAANKPGGTMFKARTDAWAAEALTAFDLGNGDPAKLDAAVTDAKLELAKAPPAIRQFLEDSGYGSHPDAIRWLRAVHARTAEKPIVQGDIGKVTPTGKTMAQLMYPDMAAPTQ